MDYSGSQNRAPSILASVYTFLGAVVLTLSLRIYTRARVTRHLGVDDVLMLLSLTLYIASTVIVQLGTNSGVGRHHTELTLSQIIGASKYITLWEDIYVANTAMIKLSIGYSLLRIGGHKIYSYIIYALCFIDFVHAAVVIIIAITQCSPVSYEWNQVDPTAVGHCRSRRVLADLAYAVSGITICLDIALTILPICMLWNVKINRQLKISVVFLMSLGMFACIANFIRLKYIIQLNSSPEETVYNISDIIIWSAVEAGAGMVCSSLAMLRPLLREWHLLGVGDSQKSYGENSFAKSRTRPVSGRVWESELQSRHHGSSKSRVTADVCSEDNILYDEESLEMKDPGIIRRTDITVVRNGSMDISP